VKTDGGASELVHVIHELSWIDLLGEIF
jgi:hypothetical protein